MRGFLRKKDGIYSVFYVKSEKQVTNAGSCKRYQT